MCGTSADFHCPKPPGNPGELGSENAQYSPLAMGDISHGEGRILSSFQKENRALGFSFWREEEFPFRSAAPAAAGAALGKGKCYCCEPPAGLFTAILCLPLLGWGRHLNSAGRLPPSGW